MLFKTIQNIFTLLRCGRGSGKPIKILLIKVCSRNSETADSLNQVYFQLILTAFHIFPPCDSHPARVAEPLPLSVSASVAAPPNHLPSSCEPSGPAEDLGGPELPDSRSQWILQPNRNSLKPNSDVQPNRNSK